MCEEQCSVYCKSTGCDINNGSCECNVGYAGNPCTECPKNCDRTGCNDDFRCYACNPGFFDNFCNETCSQHCLNNTCNRDGRCHECDPGFYGDYCNLTCSTNCINGTCNRDGTCNCTVGYGGHPCEPCPKNCSDTGCNEQLICHECDPGFYGDYCNLTCSINCINGTCNRDGSCSCKEGFDGLGCCPKNCVMIHHLCVHHASQDISQTFVMRHVLIIVRITVLAMEKGV